MATLITHANLYTPTGTAAAHGSDMAHLRHITDATIEIADDGTIAKVTEGGQAPTKDKQVIDAAGRVVLPGFVDSHTHMVFGGYRPDEFSWRLRGVSYMEIMERGGGIVSTMKATRATSTDELLRRTRRFLHIMASMGITTVEGKSGYGLDRGTELRQLEVMAQLKADTDVPVDVVSTYLGAHAVPPEYAGRTDDYVDFMIEEMLPVIRERKLADVCDVFCERGVFSVDQSRRLLESAKAMGMRTKLHADEIVCTHGAELAAEIGALSADHLLHIADEGIKALAESETIATLLPPTAFTLREPFAPARRMIDAGCAVALATDFNPGSCCSGSIPLTFALACIYMGMTVEEAVTALTLNGAAALGLAHDRGTIEPGKRADLVMLCSDNINILPYYTAMNAVSLTMSRGRIVADNINSTPCYP